jgi:hypothetical protein
LPDRRRGHGRPGIFSGGNPEALLPGSGNREDLLKKGTLEYWNDGNSIKKKNGFSLEF